MAEQTNKSWWEALLDTAADVGKTAVNAVYGSKTAESQAGIYIGEQAQKEQDARFWKKFAIITGAAVGGLVLGKVLKLF